MYVCDCRRSVAKDPGLDVHGFCFRVCYGHIYYPLQAFTLVTCHKENTHSKVSWEDKKTHEAVWHSNNIWDITPTLLRVVHVTYIFTEATHLSLLLQIELSQIKHSPGLSLLPGYTEMKVGNSLNIWLGQQRSEEDQCEQNSFCSINLIRWCPQYRWMAKLSTTVPLFEQCYMWRVWNWLNIQHEP